MRIRQEGLAVSFFPGIAVAGCGDSAVCTHSFCQSLVTAALLSLLQGGVIGMLVRMSEY